MSAPAVEVQSWYSKHEAEVKSELDKLVPDLGGISPNAGYDELNKNNKLVLQESYRALLKQKATLVQIHHPKQPNGNCFFQDSFFVALADIKSSEDLNALIENTIKDNKKVGKVNLLTLRDYDLARLMFGVLQYIYDHIDRLHFQPGFFKQIGAKKITFKLSFQSNSPTFDRLIKDYKPADSNVARVLASPSVASPSVASTIHRDSKSSEDGESGDLREDSVASNASTQTTVLQNLLNSQEQPSDAPHTSSELGVAPPLEVKIDFAGQIAAAEKKRLELKEQLTQNIRDKLASNSTLKLELEWLKERVKSMESLLNTTAANYKEGIVRLNKEKFKLILEQEGFPVKKGIIRNNSTTKLIVKVVNTEAKKDELATKDKLERRKQLLLDLIKQDEAILRLQAQQEEEKRVVAPLSLPATVSQLSPEQPPSVVSPVSTQPRQIGGVGNRMRSEPPAKQDNPVSVQQSPLRSSNSVSSNSVSSNSVSSNSVAQLPSARPIVARQVAPSADLLTKLLVFSNKWCGVLLLLIFSKTYRQARQLATELHDRLKDSQTRDYKDAKEIYLKFRLLESKNTGCIGEGVKVEVNKQLKDLEAEIDKFEPLKFQR